MKRSCLNCLECQTGLGGGGGAGRLEFGRSEFIIFVVSMCD